MTEEQINWTKEMIADERKTVEYLGKRREFCKLAIVLNLLGLAGSPFVSLHWVIVFSVITIVSIMLYCMTDYKIEQSLNRVVETTKELM